MLVAGLLGIGAAASTDSLDLLSATGGVPAMLIVNHDYVYAVHHRNMEVFDVSGGTFVPASSLELPQIAGSNYALEGNLLVLAGEGNGAIFYDISNPAAPRYVNRYGAQGQGAPYDRSHYIALDGSRMVMLLGIGQFGGGEMHLEVVDIADLENPMRTSYADLWLDDTTEAISYLGPAALRGNTLVVASGGLTALDLSVPDQVTRTSLTPIGGADTIRDMEVVGNNAAILTMGSQLIFADLSTPTAPAVRGTISLGPRTTTGGFAFDGTRAAVALNTDGTLPSGVAFVNNASLSAPVAAGSVVIQDAAPGWLGLAGDRLVGLDAPASTLRMFHADGTAGTLARHQPYARGGSVAFPAQYGGDFTASVTYDLSNPFAPHAVREVAGYFLPLQVRGSAPLAVRSDEQIYSDTKPMAKYWGLYDIVDPFNPRRIATVEHDGGAPDRIIDSLDFDVMWIDADRILVRGQHYEDSTSRCVVIDISDRDHIRERSAFSLLPDGGYRVDGMTRKGDYVYVGGVDSNVLPALAQWNIADPAHPVFVRNLTAAYANRVSNFADPRVIGNTLHFSVGTFLELMDVTNPANPTQITEIAGGSTFIYDYARDGDLLYVETTNGSPEDRAQLDVFRVGASSATLIGGANAYQGTLAVNDGLVYVLGEQASVYQHREAAPGDYGVLAALLAQKKALATNNLNGDGVVDAADWVD